MSISDIDLLMNHSPIALDNTSGSTCKFCGIHFKSKGTYGRHLDSRNGDANHPPEEIEKLRANVIRRGKSRPKESVDIAKQKKRLLAKAHNSKDTVQEKNKLRRKERDTRIKAKLKATEWFLHKLARNPDATEISTLSGFVAMFLPPQKWPSFNQVPEENEFKQVLAIVSQLGSAASNKLYQTFTDWRMLDPATKLELWRRDTYSAAQTALGEFSFHALCSAPQLLQEKQNELYENYTQGDVLELIASQDDRDT